MEWVNLLDELKSSALKEMANIGISHVATAIGEISKERITISLPELYSFSKDELLAATNQNGGVAAAYLRVDGISNLTETLILVPRKDALGLMDKFVNGQNQEVIDTGTLSLEEQKSIFLEVSTAIAATYFSAVDSMFNLKTNCSVPLISFNKEELHNFITSTVHHNEGISVKVSFSSETSKCVGSFLLIPDPHTLDVFFRNIGLV
ncbi:MAG: hypothetical protein PHO30_08650 [Candidatus Omnitrophica bacterium]|jgi:Chemotaxis protein CheC, inhibitor of MCP methylation|nr:hypothetical protein [Candidatus Omnitrophota bacterium]